MEEEIGRTKIQRNRETERERERERERGREREGERGRERERKRCPNFIAQFVYHNVSVFITFCRKYCTRDETCEQMELA